MKPKIIHSQSANESRTKDLREIHVLARSAKLITGDKVTLNDLPYRQMMMQHFDCFTSTQLTPLQRGQFIALLKKMTGKAYSKAPEIKAKLLGKITAMQHNHGFNEAYCEAITRNMFGIEKLRFCDPEQLGKLIAALQYQVKRKANAKRNATLNQKRQPKAKVNQDVNIV